MAHQTHRGWLKDPDRGILAAVYNGAQPGARVLTTNTALDGILLGTPVTPALAVDSLVISNMVASGDILIAANNGGNSQAWLWVDSSAGTMTLYGAGTAVLDLAATYVQVKDDQLLGIGTGNTARFSWDTTDANSNQLLLQLPAAGAVDSPVLIIGQSVESVDFGAAAAGADYSAVVDPRIAIFSSGAVTTGPVIEFRKARGTTAAPTVCTTGDDIGTLDFYGAVANGEYVRSASIRADIAGTIATTRGPGTLTFLTATDAPPSVLTAALTLAANQNATFGADIVLAASATIDGSAGAFDIKGKAATAAAIEISDGTTKFLAFDTRVATVGVTTIAFDISDYTLASAAGAVATGLSLAAHTLNLTGTTQVTTQADTVVIGSRTIAGDTATITVDEANSLLLIAPTEGTNVTLTAATALRIINAGGTPTNQYGLYIEELSGGATANRGIYMAGANGIQFAVADDIIFPAATAAALELSDGTTKFLALDTRVTTVGVTTIAFDISDYTLASAAGAVATGLSLAAHTLNLTGNTQVTTQADTAVIGARTIAADGAGGACTVDEANSLLVVAPTEGSNVTLTATSAIRVINAGGTPTNQYGVYIEALSGGTTANRGIYLAGANGLQFGAADDIIFPAATAAALELSDGTTKFLALDTRVTTVGVTTIALDISDYTLASASGAVATGLSLAAHTLNLTGNTQVTTQCDTVVIGARTIAADGNPGACTVDQANTLLITAPTEGSNVTLSESAALRIVNGAGTPGGQFGIMIENLTAGATNNYALYVQGANPIRLGTGTVGTGQIQMVGTTSGVVTLSVADAAGTWTMKLPADDGTNGDQLTVASGDGVCTWAGAASERQHKEIGGEHSAQDALDKLLSTRVYDFHYKEGRGTQDRETDYVGVVADEAPWAMHYGASKINPINTFGYSVLGIQALHDKIMALESKLATLQA